MRARGRLLSCLATIVIALAGFVTAGALPSAATPSTIQYVALGDSYAAGTAAKPCQLGPNGYPRQLSDSVSRIDLTANAACSGATTDTVALPPELNSARLVTLTVGAGNLGLSDVARACLAGTLGDCIAAIGPAQRELGDCPGVSPLGGDLTDLYREVAKAAPRARIVVTGYPLLFEPPADTDLTDLAAKIRAINAATAKLNCVIERSVATAHNADVNIYYVDVTEEFAGHRIGCQCTDPFINAPPSGEAFHPTAEGYAAYAEAIKTKLPNGWLDKEDRSV